MSETVVVPLETMESELVTAIREHLDAGFEQAVTSAAETIGARVLFALPAAGVVDDADQVAALWIESDDAKAIVFAVLDASRSEVRIEHDGPMGDMARLGASLIHVLGHLQHIDMPEAA